MQTAALKEAFKTTEETLFKISFSFTITELPSWCILIVVLDCVFQFAFCIFFLAYPFSYLVNYCYYYVLLQLLCIFVFMP